MVVMAIGLICSDIATATVRRPYLLERVDGQLDATSGLATHLLGPDAPNPPPGARPRLLPRGDTPNVLAARIDARGRVVKTVRGPFSSASEAFRVLPTS